MGLRQVWSEVNGFAQGLFGFVELSLVAKIDAEIVVGDGQIRKVLDRFAARLLTRDELPQMIAHVTEFAVRLGEVRHSPNRLLVRHFGLVEFVVGCQTQPEMKPCAWACWLKRDIDREKANGLIWPRWFSVHCNHAELVIEPEVRGVP